MFPIDPAGELINEGLRHVADDGEAAGHVAVDGTVTDREFALVARGEQEMPKLMGKRHQDHPA